MAKIVTIKFLEKYDACIEGKEWVKTKKTRDIGSLLKMLIKEKKDLKWGVWYLARKLPKMDKLRLAIYAASAVLYLYEEEYPDDSRPRRAIHAAKDYLKNPSRKNKDAAYAAAHAATDAANAAFADDAFYSAYAAANAALLRSAAAYAAAKSAMCVEKRGLQIEILKYGLQLLENKKY